MGKRRVNLAQSERRQWKFLLGMFGAISLVFIVLMIIQAGPAFSWKKVAFWDTGEDSQELVAMLERSVRLEEEFKGRVIVGVPTPQDIAPLEESIRLLRDYMGRTQMKDQRHTLRLDQMETKLADTQALVLVDQVARAEAAAKESESAGDTKDALESLKVALEAQKRINSSRAAGVRNPTKEASLARAIQNLEARPIAERSIEAEERARGLLSQERWTDALEALRTAYELQQQINRSYTNSSFVNSVRLERLDIEIASFATGGLIQEIETLLNKGAESMKASRSSDAALSYRAALERQTQINTDFPKSRFASREKIEQLRVLVETAESFPTAEKLRALDTSISNNLRRHAIEQARSEIESSVSTLNEFQALYRRSTLVGEELKFRIAYLGQVAADIASIQRALTGRLLPVPGTPGAQMQSVELTQGIYRRVMQANPSRNAGDDLPVESVSFEEAQEFCRRASWILGRTVRLPLREEFLGAIGPYDADTLADGQAWIGENSDQRTQSVGTSKVLSTGFFDLLGNVAEWIGTPDVAAANALVVGGSYVDRTVAYREVPVVSRPRGDRSRVVGFRVVIEGVQGKIEVN